MHYNIRILIPVPEIVLLNGNRLAQKAKEADGLVAGGYTPYSSIDARTKSFLERLYPLRHKHGFMNGKPGIAVATCAITQDCAGMPPACDNGANDISFYMMEEGMNFLGSGKIRGNIPCIRCGYGDVCQSAGLKMIFGENATVDSVGVSTAEKQDKGISAVWPLYYCHGPLPCPISPRRVSSTAA